MTEKKRKKNRDAYLLDLRNCALSHNRNKNKQKERKYIVVKMKETIQKNCDKIGREKKKGKKKEKISRKKRRVRGHIKNTYRSKMSRKN